MPRGRLRIYLGAAPGVGKTVAMLAEGARRVERGTEVVVAYVETHGRPHTQRMTSGLEVMQRKTVSYRGASFEEMDVDAVLERRPQVALVDELAHTNAPGCANEKRWQDVELLLSAGIDVISTVNIQHLESLNDAVFSITGVRQQETVPDHVVRGADQIELVDMSPEALRRRMSHGNIYKAEKIDAALSNYFRIGNLGALRELALLWLADRVDESLERYRGDHGITGQWPTRERVVVAVSGGSEGATLLRRGARIASRGAGGELHAVYMAHADGLVGSSMPQIAALRELTEELGGTFHTVTGDDTAEAILDLARGLNATQIVLGASRRPPWRRMMTGGVGDEVVAQSGDIDVLVVTHSKAGQRALKRIPEHLPGNRVLAGALLAVLLPAVLAIGLTVLPFGVGLPLIVMVFLGVTVVVAMVGGLWPAMVAAVFSSLLINWCFTPPLHTLTIADPENALAVVFFVAIAVAVSSVVHSSARRANAARKAQQESAALAELTHTLLGSTDQMALLLRRAADMFSAHSVTVLTKSSEDQPEPVVVDSTEERSTAAKHDLIITEPINDTHDLVITRSEPLPAEHRRLLAAYAVHAGAILNRRSLQASAGDAESLARDNRARTALLSAVSHDLRTPLAAIKAAIGSLRSDEVTFSEEDQAELEGIIEESADRLDSLIGNLLDMSRLQVGALVARVNSVDLAETVPVSIGSVSSPERITWQLCDDARLVQADAGLLDRVLGNILENALRYAPADTQVRVASSRHSGTVQIRVVDRGPGLDESARAQLFVPFQRLGDVPQGDGVGLGLAVAKGLTEAMGGLIDVEDTPGGGLTFVLEFPAAPTESRDPNPGGQS